MKITVIKGDGIGPEVITEGIKILKVIATYSNQHFEILNIEGGGKYYVKNGVEWPEGSFETCKEADAILFGAIGYPGARLPNNDIAGAGIILGLRFGLDLFANIRPTKLYNGVKHKISDKFKLVWEPKNVDFTIIRENTEGLYAPIRGTLKREIKNNIALDNRIITEEGSSRIIRFAFDYSKAITSDRTQTRKPSLTVIHKNNLLAGCQLFTKIFYELAKEYEDVQANDILVDAFTAELMRNPENFDVCVTTNMFGDICTDLASVLQGGMGMAPSAQINGWDENSKGLFEPIHGSAPDIAGKNIANPYATLLSVKMMIDWLGIKQKDIKLRTLAKTLEEAISDTISNKFLPKDLGGSYTTDKIGTEVARTLKSKCELLE
ncbi:MAG: isocitrate/isopropylmalate dehydrogenase family protein [Candidatus Hodarchaeales archaeon]